MEKVFTERLVNALEKSQVENAKAKTFNKFNMIFFFLELINSNLSLYDILKEHFNFTGERIFKGKSATSCTPTW